MKDVKVTQLEHHRNGISGLPFYVAIVEGHIDGKQRKMLVIRHSQEVDKLVGQIACAAFDMAMLADGDIAFMSNSWRGDSFDVVVDAAIAKRCSEYGG